LTPQDRKSYDTAGILANTIIGSNSLLKGNIKQKQIDK
jgi:hypothetical protein